MASFQPLEPREEDELHKSRLLNVEEKPFKRITKRLLAPGSLVSIPSKLPTPPPDTMDERAAAQEAGVKRQKQSEDHRQFREDVLLDFAAFDSSIARIQFLYNSNERERERYKADKQRILDTAQAVRDNTTQLRVQLEEAKKTLEQRKKFDELTEKITNNKLLRPRGDQEINLRKLEEECRELERESAAYAETWKERREQFGRIVEEGMQLRRLIRDEKEEVERREGMDGGEEDGEVGEESGGSPTPKHTSISGNATPKPDAPGHSNPDVGLKPRPALSGSLSRATSRGPSPDLPDRRIEGATVREDSVISEAGTKTIDSNATADTPMAEVETPRVTINGPASDSQATAEEGEAEDKMDMT